MPAGSPAGKPGVGLGSTGEGGPGVAAGSCERQVPTDYTLNVCVHPKFLCWTLTLRVAVFGGGASEEVTEVK